MVGLFVASGCGKDADRCTLATQGGLTMELGVTKGDTEIGPDVVRDVLRARAAEFKLPCPAQVEARADGSLELTFIGLRDTAQWHSERSLLLEPGVLTLSVAAADTEDGKADVFTVDGLSAVELEASGNSSVLTMTINAGQQEALAAFTGRYVGKRITVIRDGALITTAKLADPIKDGRMQLTVARTSGELKPLARRLRHPPLPVAVKPVSVRWTAPTP